MKHFRSLSPSFVLLATALFAFTPRVTGRIGKYGDSCSRDPDCDQNNLIGCNRVTRTCACPETPGFRLYYSPLEAKCVSYVDGICTYTETPPLPPIKCVDNAVCVRLRDPTELNGKCVCKTGYYRTKGNQCAKNVPVHTANTIGGGGGIETPRGSGGGAGAEGTTKSAGARNYPEPYHSYSGAPQRRTGSEFSVTVAIVLSFVLKMWNFV